MKKIIGIDFDGTCVTDLYPYVGDNIGAASVLRELGDKNLLILYTVRDGKYLQDAVDWFRYNHINLYSVNYNPEPVSSSPKLYCDYYIDDRNIGTPLTDKGYVDWNKKMFEYKFDYISSALEDYTNISVYNFYCDNNDKDNINRKPNTGMIDQYMDYIKFINDNVDEENKIIYDTIMMIGDASGKEGQFSDSDKKTAENFGCEYMDVDDFVYKYNNR